VDRCPRIRITVFEGFELLDVFGPLELLGSLAPHLETSLVAPQGGWYAAARASLSPLPTSSIPASPATCSSCLEALAPGSWLGIPFS